jgi:hypothetical protein
MKVLRISDPVAMENSYQSSNKNYMTTENLQSNTSDKFIRRNQPSFESNVSLHHFSYSDLGDAGLRKKALDYVQDVVEFIGINGDGKTFDKLAEDNGVNVYIRTNYGKDSEGNKRTLVKFRVETQVGLRWLRNGCKRAVGESELSIPKREGKDVNYENDHFAKRFLSRLETAISNHDNNLGK